MPSLNGKTALVTGASRGMGRASALALAAAGAQVLVHYGRGAKEAEGVVAEIRKGGGRADAIAVDLATADGAGTAEKPGAWIGERVTIAGRMLNVRDFGKLMFAPVIDRSGRIQVGFQRDKLGDWPFEIGLWVGRGATPNEMGRKGDGSENSARSRTIR